MKLDDPKNNSGARQHSGLSAGEVQLSALNPALACYIIPDAPTVSTPAGKEGDWVGQSDGTSGSRLALPGAGAPVQPSNVNENHPPHPDHLDDCACCDNCCDEVCGPLCEPLCNVPGELAGAGMRVLGNCVQGVGLLGCGQPCGPGCCPCGP